MNQNPPYSPDEPGRRRSPRVDVHGQLDLKTSAPPGSLTLINVSAGGFLIHSHHPAAVGDAHDCVFSRPDGSWSASLRARVVYTLTLSPVGQEPAEYASGFAFVETDNPVVQQRIKELMDQVLGRAALRW